MVFSKNWKFLSGLSKLHWSCPDKHSESLFLYFSQVCFCFWTLSWKFLDFGIKDWPLLSLLQATFPREKNIVGKLRKLFRASDVERFFLVFQQKKSVVVPNLLSTLYLSSGRLCAVCFSKVFKSSQIFARIKWNFFTFSESFFRNCCQNSAPHDRR